MTFDMFLASMLYHCRQLFPEEFSVSVICDDDEELALPTYKLFRLAKKQNEIAKRVRGICFADDLAYIPLQAADLIANTFYRDKIRAESDPPLPESNIFKTLVGGTRVYFFHITADLLREMASHPHGFTFDFVPKAPEQKEWRSS